jgi:catechol 2,3-dioxygenase-like lactoylglutathione lyase family enzyme
MEHVGIVVDDLAAATAFFVELGLMLQGEWSVEGGWVDRIVGLEGVRAESAMLETPDGHGRLELVKFHAPSASGSGQVRTRALLRFGCLPLGAAPSCSQISVESEGGLAAGVLEQFQDLTETEARLALALRARDAEVVALGDRRPRTMKSGPSRIAR